MVTTAISADVFLVELRDDPRYLIGSPGVDDTGEIRYRPHRGAAFQQSKVIAGVNAAAERTARNEERLFHWGKTILTVFLLSFFRYGVEIGQAADAFVAAGSPFFGLDELVAVFSRRFTFSTVAW